MANTHTTYRSLLPAMALLAFVAIGSGCSSTTSPSAEAVAESFDQAKPLSTEEQDEFLAAHQRAAAVGASTQALNVAAGLDPLGLSRMVADANVRASQAELQAHVPAAVAYAYSEAEAFCAQNPKLPDCVEFMRLQRANAGRTGWPK